MSTNISSNDEDNRAFTRLPYATITILALSCIVLFYLTSTSQSRLRRAQIDVKAVTQQSGQRLVLSANQPVGKVSAQNVTITPSAEFSISTKGEDITMQFTERLRYNTDYTVRVGGIKNANGETTFDYTFSTADSTLFYIKRGPGDDSIIKYSLADSSEEVVYSTPKIQDFALTDSGMIVATLDDDNLSKLAFINEKTKKIIPLLLPETGTVTKLQASTNQKIAGFIFSSKNYEGDMQTYDKALFLINFDAQTIVYPLSRLDKKSIPVLNYVFAPDGTTILAHYYDESLSLIDTNRRNTSVPIGSALGIYNFSSTGQLFSAYAPEGPVLIDSLSYKKTLLTYKKIDGQIAETVDVQLSRNGPGFITRLFVSDLLKDEFKDYFVFKNGDKTRVITAIDSGKTTVQSMTTSSNDQYLVLVVNDFNDTPDTTYNDTPSAATTRTLIIDMQTGKTVKTIDGLALKWK